MFLCFSNIVHMDISYLMKCFSIIFHHVTSPRCRHFFVDPGVQCLLCETAAARRAKGAHQIDDPWKWINDEMLVAKRNRYRTRRHLKFLGFWNFCLVNKLDTNFLFSE